MVSDIATYWGQIIGAVAALGTAAYGLVDASKAFAGGASNFGFGHIRKALDPFKAALAVADGDDWTLIMRANWINGMSKDDQKAKAKGLIRLGLTSTNAVTMAEAARINPPSALADVVKKLEAADTLSDVDLTVLGRFDSIVDAALDGGFERADQAYRNGSKACAAFIALILAVLGERAIAGANMSMAQFGLSLLVGAVSVPLAPVAKDLSSTLVAAVKAMKVVGG